MTTAHSEEHKPDSLTSRLPWLILVLLFALLAAGLWYYGGHSLTAKHAGHGEEHETEAVSEHGGGEHTAAATVAGRLDEATGDYIYETGKMVTIDLPNDAGKLAVGENSTENKLFQFLSDKNAALDTVAGNWFEFTNVRFKTGGAVIDSSSLTQIKNIAAICKAFPAAQFKVGGYTDNSGDAAVNVALSQKRADAVLAELKAQGVSAAAFTGAKGYGPEHPIGDNATAEGKAMNRRVAVNVKAK